MSLCCHKCAWDERNRRPADALYGRVMIVCEHCGNKRCPHASNHALPCTGSNDRGQAGSVYQ